MTLNISRLAQISYPVSDVERAIGFFRDKLGLPLALRPHPHMAFFVIGGVSLMMERSDDVSKASVIYLAVADVAASTRELESRGVEIVSQPHRITEQPTYDLWMSFFNDPDGRLIGLSMEAPKGWRPA